MVDLHGQYLKIKTEVNKAIQRVIDSSAFIKGEDVHAFQDELSLYMDVPHTIACGNGTDALQLAMMALGLQAGDEVIRRMADYLHSAVRRGDLVGRLGGDEFALLVGASASQAYDLLDRLRQRVASHRWTLADGREPQLSLSIGMVECGRGGLRQLGELLQAADAALYVAKDQGRNQVMDLQRLHPRGWSVQPA